MIKINPRRTKKINQYSASINFINQFEDFLKSNKSKVIEKRRRKKNKLKRTPQKHVTLSANYSLELKVDEVYGFDEVFKKVELILPLIRYGGKAKTAKTKKKCAIVREEKTIELYPKEEKENIFINFSNESIGGGIFYSGEKFLYSRSDMTIRFKFNNPFIFEDVKMKRFSFRVLGGTNKEIVKFLKDKDDFYFSKIRYGIDLPNNSNAVTPIIEPLFQKIKTEPDYIIISDDEDNTDEFDDNIFWKKRIMQNYTVSKEIEVIKKIDTNLKGKIIGKKRKRTSENEPNKKRKFEEEITLSKGYLSTLLQIANQYNPFK